MQNGIDLALSKTKFHGWNVFWGMNFTFRVFLFSSEKW